MCLKRRMRQDIVALRNEKGSYSQEGITPTDKLIVALRNEKGSYSS